MGLLCEEGLNKVRARLATVDPQNRQVVAVFKIRVKQNGQVVKNFMLDLIKVDLYEGDDNADCTIALEDQVFADILGKKLDATEAIQKDLIEVDGNLELLKVLKEQISTI